jgi:hypothetical protein
MVIHVLNIRLQVQRLESSIANAVEFGSQLGEDRVLNLKVTVGFFFSLGLVSKADVFSDRVPFGRVADLGAGWEDERAGRGERSWDRWGGATKGFTAVGGGSRTLRRALEGGGRDWRGHGGRLRSRHEFRCCGVEVLRVEGESLEVKGMELYRARLRNHSGCCDLSEWRVER